MTADSPLRPLATGAAQGLPVTHWISDSVQRCPSAPRARHHRLSGSPGREKRNAPAAIRGSRQEAPQTFRGPSSPSTSTSLKSLKLDVSVRALGVAGWSCEPHVTRPSADIEHHGHGGNTRPLVVTREPRLAIGAPTYSSRREFSRTPVSHRRGLCPEHGFLVSSLLHVHPPAASHNLPVAARHSIPMACLLSRRRVAQDRGLPFPLTAMS